MSPYKGKRPTTNGKSDFGKERWTDRSSDKLSGSERSGWRSAPDPSSLRATTNDRWNGDPPNVYTGENWSDLGAREDDEKLLPFRPVAGVLASGASESVKKDSDMRVIHRAVAGSPLKNPDRPRAVGHARENE